MSEEKKSIVLFNDRKIRRLWDEEEWFFSVVDIVEVLTESGNRPHQHQPMSGRGGACPPLSSTNPPTGPFFTGKALEGVCVYCSDCSKSISSSRWP